MDRPQAQVWGPGLEPGKRLLPAVIDHCAEKNPNRIYASIPYTDDPADGYRDITYRQFATAIDKAAWWLQSVIGKGNGGIFDTFAYTGPKGLRYPVLAIAAIKIGKRVRTDLASPIFCITDETIDASCLTLPQRRRTCTSVRCHRMSYIPVLQYCCCCCRGASKGVAEASTYSCT